MQFPRHFPLCTLLEVGYGWLSNERLDKRIDETPECSISSRMYIERCVSAACAQVANVFSLFPRDCRLFFHWLFPETEKKRKETGPLLTRQTQFASYNQSHESPEGLFSGRLHATNSSDEFAFRGDGGYHSQSQPFCEINTSIDIEKPQGTVPTKKRENEDG